MKAAGLFCCFAMVSPMAQAQEWQPQYLSYNVEGMEDYPLAIVVPEGDHEFAEAYFRNMTGRGVYLGCDNRYASYGPELAFGQAGDHMFLGVPPDLIVSFDDDPPLPIRDLQFQPGRYWAPLSLPLLEGFQTADEVWVRTANGETVIRAPLDGAAQAIAVLDCLAMAGV